MLQFFPSLFCALLIAIRGKQCNVNRSAFDPKYAMTLTQPAAPGTDELLDAGDMEGRRVWLTVLKAVKELSGTEPPGDGQVSIEMPLGGPQESAGKRWGFGVPGLPHTGQGASRTPGESCRRIAPSDRICRIDAATHEGLWSIAPEPHGSLGLVRFLVESRRRCRVSGTSADDPNLPKLTDVLH